MSLLEIVHTEIDTVRTEIETAEARLATLQEIEALALRLANPVEEVPAAEPSPPEAKPPAPKPSPPKAKAPAREPETTPAHREAAPQPTARLRLRDVLVLLQNEPDTVTGIARSLGLKFNQSGELSGPAKRSVEEALDELERDGQIHEAGKRGRGVVWAAEQPEVASAALAAADEQEPSNGHVSPELRARVHKAIKGARRGTLGGLAFKLGIPREDLQAAAEQLRDEGLIRLDENVVEAV